MIALGLEGSANKLGIGIIRHPAHPKSSHKPAPPAEILSNIRHTYNAPAGSGFLPKDTARHHRQHITSLIHRSLAEAQLSTSDIDVICYTKGPGMGAPLQSVAIAELLERIEAQEERLAWQGERIAELSAVDPWDAKLA